MGSPICPFCGIQVQHNDTNAWKKVTGWVGGPRKDSMKLREDTGDFAHDSCVKLVQQGQEPGQPNLFDEE